MDVFNYAYVYFTINKINYFEISVDEILAIVKSHSDSTSSAPSAVCKKLYRCKSVEKDL